MPFHSAFALFAQIQTIDRFAMKSGITTWYAGSSIYSILIFRLFDKNLADGFICAYSSSFRSSNENEVQKQTRPYHIILHMPSH
jgi:hypothetical protein